MTTVVEVPDVVLEMAFGADMATDPDAAPFVAGVGTASAGTGDVTPSFPDDVRPYDVLVLFCESNNETVATPAGWSIAPDSPQSDATDATRLSVFWKYADGTETGTLTVADPGNHCIAQIMAVRGCDPFTSPFDVTAGSSEGVSDTSVSIPGDVTTGPNRLVVAAACTGFNSNSAQFSGWTNANLASITEYLDACTVSGGGGGFGVAAGVKAAAGDYGSTTATLANASRKGLWSAALKGFQWTDVTDLLHSWDGGPGGRQRDLDEVEAGTMTFKLNNYGGEFDPANPDSPYYPHVTTNVPVRFKTADGDPIFRGYADAWPQTYDANGFVASVSLPCTDAFKVMAQAQLPGSYWASQIPRWADLTTTVTIGGVSVTQPQLRAWWRLGEVDGASVVTDAGPNKFKGVVRARPDFRQDSLLLFDGENNGAVAFPTATTGGYPTVILPTQASADQIEFALHFLVKRDENPSGNGEVLWEQSQGLADDALAVSLQSNGTVRFALILDTLLFVAATTISVCDGNVHAITARRQYDSGAGTGTIKLIVDRVERASTNVNNGTVTAATYVGLGNAAAEPSEASRLKGILDEVVTLMGHTEITDIQTDHDHALRPGAAGDAITAALDAMDWPGELRALDALVTTLQPHALTGAVLEFIQRVTRTEGGLFYVSAAGVATFKNRDFFTTSPGNVSQLTFGSGAGETAYSGLTPDFDETNVYTQARVGREEGSAFTVDDAFRQQKHGVRTFDATDLMHDDDEESIDRANWVVSTKKAPRQEFRSLVVDLAHPSVVAADVLALKVGDLVTVRHKPRPDDDQVIERDARIEQVTHSGEPAKQWTVTLRLSPWDDTIDQPWLLGDSVYGVLDTTTRLGF